jgi:hypothetical protein
MQIPSDLIAAGISFIVTVLILSYLFGDNPLFRATMYVFVGVSAGYVAAVAWNQVISPLLLGPILSGAAFADSGQAVQLIIPLLGSALLLFKISPRFSNLGLLPVAYLVGVGAAVAVGGGVLGTLIPQVEATIVSNVLVLIGVIGTLAYFHFGATQKADGSVRRNILVNALTWVGRIYIAITFGVLFAGVYMAALTALIERMDSIRSFIFLLMQ